uniref:Uncharacterized protein n=1 Tax=Arundo donax TaxID=35708 RepID=A0A0A8ZJQ7_ARUDO
MTMQVGEVARIQVCYSDMLNWSECDCFTEPSGILL